MSTKTRFAIRSVKLRSSQECLENYLKEYDATVRTGSWKDRQRDNGETTWSTEIEESWVEIEMRLAHLPAFMKRMGHPVILDLEEPEIRTHTNPEWRTDLHKWSIWTGPPRPAYKLTIYDDYRE